MSTRYSPRERELYLRCDEVLHYRWDPFLVELATEEMGLEPSSEHALATANTLLEWRAVIWARTLDTVGFQP